MSFRTVLLITLFSVSNVLAQYDPPEVLATFSHDSLRSPFPFICVDDQNDDSYDDFIFSSRGRIMLFNGGAELDTHPAFTINKPEDRGQFGIFLQYNGRLSNSVFGSFNVLGLSDIEDERYYFIDIFAGGANLDTIADYTYSGKSESFFVLSSGHSSNPYDLNNDGYDDLLLSEYNSYYKYLTLFYGGDEFDTIPDWRYDPGFDDGIQAGAEISSGSDINADGYDDVFVKYNGYGVDEPYMLFLGGEEMADEPLFRYGEHIFEEGDENYARVFSYGFVMLNDINGDGYDDWAHHWVNNLVGSDGVLVFFGGEEPDLEPDLNLEGHASWIENETTIAGGDFNGDSFGDIVSAQWGAYRYDGEINFYFGGEEMSGDADLKINTREEYGIERLGKQIGAVGDYNGDGSDDFLAYYPDVGDYQYRGTLVLSGWKNYAVEEEPIPCGFDFELTAYPNPFNSSVELSYTLDVSAIVYLIIYDIQGKQVAELVHSGNGGGMQSVVWNADKMPSGEYIVHAKSGNENAMQKVVLIK